MDKLRYKHPASSEKKRKLTAVAMAPYDIINTDRQTDRQTDIQAHPYFYTSV